MKLTKALGFAAIAVVAAMAFIGTSTAAAEHLVVICDELPVALCPAGHLWKVGSVVLALAKSPKLKGTFLGIPIVIECEDSLVELKLLQSTSEAGKPLLGEITSLKFGKLPTPTLGEGCTECTGGVHSVEPLGAGNLEMVGSEYFLNGTGEATLLNCPFNSTCIYKGTNVKSEAITHNGTHPKHSGSNLPLIKINKALAKQPGSGAACPATGTWEASYTLTLVHLGAKTGLGWPALDEKIEKP